MTTKTILLATALCLFTVGMRAQVALDSTGRDAQYVKAIEGRAQKIVDKLQLADDAVRLNVAHIISNRYFTLADIHDRCDLEVKATKASTTLSGAEKTEAVSRLQNARDAQLYKHHFEFAATLANYLTPAQVEAVKDGMTYNVVKVTYDATLDMIPTLKADEKLQILNWLKEAREFAMDAGTSKAKHEWFGKYKGRINNWLSARGYDLVKEREAWYKRIEARKQQKK